jgi:hypothetical protein
MRMNRMIDQQSMPRPLSEGALLIAALGEKKDDEGLAA